MVSNLPEDIKRANRAVYNRMSVEHYNSNESIFNEQRRAACTAILSSAAESSGNERYLDIGTGTGNLLRLACPLFEKCFAIDIGERLLVQIQPEFPDAKLAAADAEQVPFKDNTFNCVSCYAMLHHLYSHETLFREIYRILIPGGTLYTDHDPNYFLNRFYRPLYRWRFREKTGFSSATEELAEYHNTVSPGINPEKLRQMLLDAGFSNIEIRYRLTDRPHWGFPMNIIVPCLRMASEIIAAKSFFTHFSIIAIK